MGPECEKDKLTSANNSLEILIQELSKSLKKMELLVIDRLLYKFFGVIDNFFEWLTAPRCKCKKKKK
jgi:hypothetical protein